MKRRIPFAIISAILLACPAWGQPAPMPLTIIEKPPAVIEQPAGNWTDWPIMAGDWVYRRDVRGSIALFGVPGHDASLILRCDTGLRRVFLLRVQGVPNTAPGAPARFTIRTSALTKEFLAVPAGNISYIAAEILPYDPILDAMAYSRGRFAVEVTGQKNIAIPAWSEVSHIVEDCRF